MSSLRSALVVFALLSPLPLASKTSLPSLSLLTIRLQDLRPGYVLVSEHRRDRASLHGKTAVSASVLLAHGWIDGYDALYRRREAPGVEVGDLADRFQTDAGAHWWYGVSLLRVPAGYKVVSMPRVGTESTAVQSRAFLGIIFRRHGDVADVYVSIQAPQPLLAVLALARLVDGRLRQDRLPPPQARRPPPVHSHPPALRVFPNPLPTDSYPTITARTVPGASCTARITLASGQAARVLPRPTRAADASGRVSWFWHQAGAAGHGTATVSCAARGNTVTARTDFRVTA